MDNGDAIYVFEFYFFRCSKTVNLPFALESEVKLSVEPESQSSECDLSILLRLLFRVALSHKLLFTISFSKFFAGFELLATLFTSHVLLKYCRKLKAKIPELFLFGWSLLPFR